MYRERKTWSSRKFGERIFFGEDDVFQMKKFKTTLISAIEAKEKIQGQRKARKSKRKQREHRIADRANQLDKAMPLEKENEKATEDTIKIQHKFRHSGVS